MPTHPDAHVSNECPIPLPSFVQPDLCRRNKPSWDMVYCQGYNLETEIQQLAWVCYHSGCGPRKNEVDAKMGSCGQLAVSVELKRSIGGDSSVHVPVFL